MKRKDSLLSKLYYQALPKAKEGGNYFNKYKVPVNTTPEKRVDPILNFFNGGFMMPANEGGNINFPSEMGYRAPRLANGGDISIADLRKPSWIAKYAPGGPTCGPGQVSINGKCVAIDSDEYKAAYQKGIGSWQTLDKTTNKWKASESTDPNAEWYGSTKTLPEVVVTSKANPYTTKANKSAIAQVGSFEDFRKKQEAGYPSWYKSSSMYDANKDLSAQQSAYSNLLKTRQYQNVLDAIPQNKGEDRLAYMNRLNSMAGKNFVENAKGAGLTEPFDPSNVDLMKQWGWKGLSHLGALGQAVSNPATAPYAFTQGIQRGNQPVSGLTADEASNVGITQPFESIDNAAWKYGFKPGITALDNTVDPSGRNSRATAQRYMGPSETDKAFTSIMNPLNYIGAGELLSGGRNLIRGAEGLNTAVNASKESGLLSNAYRINPFAERLNSANKSYRVAGLDALQDFQNTGVLRSMQQGLPEGATLAERAMNRPTSFPSFQKGYADLRYLPEEGGAIFETSLPTFKRGQINPVTGNQIRGRHYAHRVINPETGATLSEIPGVDIKAYGSKPNWLRGYQEIPNKSNQSFSNIFTEELPVNLEDQLKIVQGNYIKKDLPKNYILDSDINKSANKEMDWLQSDEYLKRRSATTGETPAEIKKDVDEILKNWETIKTTSEKSSGKNVVASYTNYGDGKSTIRLDPSLSRERALSSLDHEVKHALSQTGTTGNYKNYPTTRIGNALTNLKNSNFNAYLKKPQEQQVRALRILDFIENKYGIPRGTQLSIEDINKFAKDISIGGIHEKEFTNKYDDVLNQLHGMKQADQTLKFIPSNLSKLKFPFKYQSQGNLRQNLLNQLNKAYTIPALGVGTVLGLNENQSTDMPQQKYGGSWLSKYGPGGSTSSSFSTPSVPTPTPTPQTGSNTTGPTFSNQSGQTNDDNDKTDWMLGALGLGAAIAGFGLFGKDKNKTLDEKKCPPDYEWDKKLQRCVKRKMIQEESITNDGNGKPLPGQPLQPKQPDPEGIAWNYNPNIQAQQIQNPTAAPSYGPGDAGVSAANPSYGMAKFGGQSSKGWLSKYDKGGDVSIYGRRNYSADTPTFFAPGGVTEGGCPPGWVMGPDGNCVQDPEARKALAKKSVKIARQHIADNSYFDVPENLQKSAAAQDEGAYGCIGGVCSVYTEAGVMSKPNWSNTDFALHAKDYGFPNKGYGLDQLKYLEPGDALQYYDIGPKNMNKQYPHHSQLFLGINPDSGEYEFFDNYAKKMKSYPKEELEDYFKPDNVKNLKEYGRIFKVNPYTANPVVTNPEAIKAMEDRKKMIEWQTENGPQYEYGIRKDSPKYKDQPEGMKKFTEWANKKENIDDLVRKLGVDKGVINDELLNTFGELGQENKWENRTFAGSGFGLEGLYEKTFKPKNKSIGPGQIKFNSIDPDLKQAFNINSPKDLYDWDKVIPLMTAINIKNRKYMENQGEDLSTKLTGTPGVSADNIKYGIGRWTPYMYRGKLTDPRQKLIDERSKELDANFRLNKEDKQKLIDQYVSEKLTPDQMKYFAKGSYADKVYRNTDENLERTLINEGQLQPVEITSTRKKKQAYGGSINTNWLNKYKS